MTDTRDGVAVGYVRTRTLQIVAWGYFSLESGYVLVSGIENCTPRALVGDTIAEPSFSLHSLIPLEATSAVAEEAAPSPQLRLLPPPPQT